jgi:hypothetical protein
VGNQLRGNVDPSMRAIAPSSPKFYKHGSGSRFVA